jgi:hypothetical protein
MQSAMQCGARNAKQLAQLSRRIMLLDHSAILQAAHPQKTAGAIFAANSKK